MPRHSVVLKLPGGGSAIVCMSKPAKACQVCGQRIAGYQCDALLGKGKTCDKYLCSNCRHHVGPDLDFCPAHAAAEVRDA